MATLVHLLLDLENVQPTAAQLGKVRGAHFRLWILHGPHQKELTTDRVTALLPLGEQVRLVQSMKAGNNALDLHIAFCIGEASERDRQEGSKACYVIVSKDKGFDALFGHLKSRGILVGRAESLPMALTHAAQLTGTQPTRPKSAAPPASANTEKVLKDLREHPRNRPRTEKKLHNHVGSLLGNEAAGQEVNRVLEELKSLAAVALDGTKVKYVLA